MEDTFGTEFSASTQRQINEQDRINENKKILNSFSTKKQFCSICGKEKTLDQFGLTRSFLFANHHITVCNECAEKLIQDKTNSWNNADRLCQYANIPFSPDKLIHFQNTSNQGEAWKNYITLFYSQKQVYEGIDWKDYYDAYKELEEEDHLEYEMPLLKEKHKKELQLKWGSNYDDEALNYLETLYNGLIATQNVNGTLANDQAYKLCKISYEIDKSIEEGKDVDKLLSSYDRLVKIGDFTPANAKNASDFESVGELIKWLEKRGFKNQYYDGATRDVVDETIKNIQAYNQRLYTNESGIGDEITNRVQALKAASKLENRYNVGEYSKEQLEDYSDEIDNPDLNEEFDPGEDE